MNILVSACLLGIDTNYKGTNKKNEDVIKLKEKFNLIPICPEQLGGMTTPRIPSENKGDKVISEDGKDVTKNFTMGAEMALYVAKLFDCKYAVLKERSPSCGYGKVYDGTFTGTLINGNGTTADLLSKNGIKIFNENQINILLKEINI